MQYFCVIFIYLFFCIPGVVTSCQIQVSGSASQMTVTPGDNVTLTCNCKKSRGVHIIWYRNCSHVNQPSLVIVAKKRGENASDTTSLNPFPRFHIMKNKSSQSSDLMIMNITDSDEGLYYCGTQQKKAKDNNTSKPFPSKENSCGNVTTRILLRKYSCWSFLWKLLIYAINLTMWLSDS